MYNFDLCHIQERRIYLSESELLLNKLIDPEYEKDIISVNEHTNLQRNSIDFCIILDSISKIMNNARCLSRIQTLKNTMNIRNTNLVGHNQQQGYC